MIKPIEPITTRAIEEADIHQGTLAPGSVYYTDVDDLGGIRVALYYTPYPAIGGNEYDPPEAASVEFHAVFQLINNKAYEIFPSDDWLSNFEDEILDGLE